MTTRTDSSLPHILIDEDWEPPPRPNRFRAVIATTAVVVVGGALFVSISSGAWEQNWARTAQATQPYTAARSHSLWYPDSAAIWVDRPAPSSRRAVHSPRVPPSKRTNTRPTPRAPAREAPASVPGYLAVNATPWAQLSVDGRVIGNTPQLRVRVTPGRHQLVLAREGFQAETTWVTVEPGATVKITGIALKQVAP